VRARIYYASLAVVAAVGTSCAGDLEHPERFAATSQQPLAPPPAGCGDAEVEPLIARTCGRCHATGADATAQLDLTTPGVKVRLRGKTSSTCAPRILVTESAATSFLYGKIAGMPDCGDAMPLGGPPLTSETIDCLKAWIEASP
jgi:hypothetical protein